MFDHTTTTTNPAVEIRDYLAQADRLYAKVIAVLQTHTLEKATGLSPEIALQLDAGRSRRDARALVSCATMLAAMPWTNAAFARGILSWSQVREMCLELSTLDVHHRKQLDTELAATNTNDPHAIVQAAIDRAADVRADLALRREDRQVERSFLLIQPKLGGGSSFYGEADPISTATINEALNACADAPVQAGTEGGPTRPQQLMESFVRICEGSLSGGAQSRAKPRLLATIDINRLAGDGRAAAKVLWALAGPSPRLTPLTTAALTCDADITPVIFDGAKPIAIGDSYAPVTSKMRTALIARDQRCRFPGCEAPVQWCDSHHIQARINDGETCIENLILLCRKCHRRVHRYRWRIEVDELLGSVRFIRGGKTYVSDPPRRE